MLRNSDLVSLVSGAVVRLSTPINISFFWNFSSCIGLFLLVQIFTSVFLTIHYLAEVTCAFDSVCHIILDVNYSWVIRYIHMNSASFFLGLIYLHTCRSIYYKRYASLHAWMVGVTMLLLSILVAFLGYVLPWGQMSFWSATVITNLISAIPVYSTDVVYWLWSSYSVSAPTLTRFYTFHFLLPLVISALSILHLVFIHGGSGSGNPIGSFSSSMNLDFWPYFGYNDVFGFFFVLFFFFLLVFFFSDMFSDPDNYIKANPLVTPVHINPEWYFLFAYAILRSIPNNLLGVLALVFSILVFYFVPLGNTKFSPSFFYQFFFWLWTFNFLILTWLSSCPVKDIFNFLSQMSGVVYFLLFFFMVFF